MAEPVPKGDYALEVDYVRGTERPAGVFRAMSELIEAFQQLDQDLARSISAEIEPIVLLQEVEAGSVRAWLSTVLKSVDDTSLKKLDWRGIVGAYLLLGKRRIVQFLDKNPTITTREQVHTLELDLMRLAEQTNVRQIPAYAPIPTRRLLMSLNQVSVSVRLLGEGDRASLIVDREEWEINKSFDVPQEAIDRILTAETLSNTAEMILRVKKPDYLGQSMWEFRHQNHVILAKILDTAWLARFHTREVTLRPGDSVRAKVQTDVHYDQYGDVVAIHYSILEILDVIALPAWSQVDLYSNE